MTTKTTEPAALHFDPWPDARPPGHVRPQPELAPVYWYLLSALARGAIGGGVLVVMRANSDKTHPGDRQWLGHRVREHLVGLRDAGDRTAKVALDELQSVPLNNVPILNEVVERLLTAGSLLLTLRAERTRLDVIIERLTEMAAPR